MQILLGVLGGTIARKGFDLVWRAYHEEFSEQEDVCLTIKDAGVETFYRFGNARAIHEYIERGFGPEVLYFDDDRPPGQLASLYTTCDCLVAPYRGEGFGLPILEAMACGTPAIVPNAGPAVEFVDEATGVLVPCQEVDVAHEWRTVGRGTNGRNVVARRSTFRTGSSTRSRKRRFCETIALKGEREVASCAS